MKSQKVNYDEDSVKTKDLPPFKIINEDISRIREIDVNPPIIFNIEEEGVSRLD